MSWEMVDSSGEWAATNTYSEFWQEIDRHQIDLASGLDHELRGSRHADSQR